MTLRFGPLPAPAWLAGVICLSLLLRLAALWACPFIGSDGGVDGVAMSLVGKNLMSGEGFQFQDRPETVHAPLFPVLIGLVWAVTGDIFTAGLVVSALASAFLVVPLFFLARDLVGELAARWASLLGAVFPPYIFAATEVRVASLYACVYLWFVLALWRVCRQPNLRRGALAGAVLGLAYLARPEALLLLPSAAAAALLAQAGSFRRRVCRLCRPGLAGAGAFGLLGAPYWFFLHRHLGRWTLSARAPFTFIPYFSANWEEANFQAYAYPEQVREQWNALGGYLGLLREHGQEMLGRFFDNLGSLLRVGSSPEFGRMGLPAAPLSVVFLLGLAVLVVLYWRRVAARRADFRDLFVCLLCLPMLPYFFLTDFMTSQKLRYLFPYLGFILLAAGTWLGRVSWRGRLSALPGLLILAALFGVDAWLIPAKATMVPWEYRLLGERMRREIPDLENTVVMSQRMGVPFYAGARHAAVPPGPPSRVLDYAREVGARYLVVSDWTTPTRRPDLLGLLSDEPSSFPWLVRVGRESWRGRRAVLYRLVETGEAVP